jgi:hypothetical protein
MGMTILLCFATAFSGGAPHQDATTTTGTPARASASCEHPLRKQQSGVNVAESRLVGDNVKTLVESIQWKVFLG